MIMFNNKTTIKHFKVTHTHPHCKNSTRKLNKQLKVHLKNIKNKHIIHNLLPSSFKLSI